MRDCRRLDICVKNELLRIFELDIWDSIIYLLQALREVRVPFRPEINIAVLLRLNIFIGLPPTMKDACLLSSLDVISQLVQLLGPEFVHICLRSSHEGHFLLCTDSWKGMCVYFRGKLRISEFIFIEKWHFIFFMLYVRQLCYLFNKLICFSICLWCFTAVHGNFFTEFLRKRQLHISSTRHVMVLCHLMPFREAHLWMLLFWEHTHGWNSLILLWWSWFLLRFESNIGVELLYVLHFGLEGLLLLF